MGKSLTLILGGARSGKSSLAQSLAMKLKRVLFVATAEAGDGEIADRIRSHKESRPDEWDTLEEPLHLVSALAQIQNDYDLIIMDCLTLWVSNLMLSSLDAEKVVDYLSRVQELMSLYNHGGASWIVVSNEVGMGVVPPTKLGRHFADELGRVNQSVASHADFVYFMAAGLPLQIKGERGKDPLSTNR